jgi:hypothetical protein
VGGHIDLMFDQPPSSLPHVRGGSIKAYAVGKTRHVARAARIQCWAWLSCRKPAGLLTSWERGQPPGAIRVPADNDFDGFGGYLETRPFLKAYPHT